jgi:uncharacterized membrane protein YdjX (TVP38/TMEM64 family)
MEKTPMVAHREVDETAAPAPGRGGRAALRRFVPLAAIVLGLVAFFAFDLDRFVSLSALSEHHEALRALVADNGVLASAAYLLAYAVAVALSIPGAAVLTIAGGFMFGIVWGSLLVVSGATLGAVAIFLAARTALGDVLRRRAGPWVQKLEAGFRENAFSYLLTLRLIPVVPFWLVNIVPAFFGVRLGTFALSTVLGIVPGTVVYVGVGNGLGATLDAGRDPDLGIIFEPAILLPLLGLAVLSLVPVVYRKVKGRRPA